jgi:CubicO group peptidase (beta-lactamase class C family)
MTSGLTDSLGGDYQPLSRGRMLAEAMRSRLLSPPGKAWHYSNVSYSILAAIIEKVSGMGYEQFLARYLFRPAGMWHTGYVLPRWQVGGIIATAPDMLRWDSPLGPVAAHNGSNGWSFAVIARLLRQKVLVFWASNHAFQAGHWNLEHQQVSLTYGLLQAALSRA